MRGGVKNGFAHWLMPLLDPDQVLRGELKAAEAGKSQATLEAGMGDLARGG